ncbi:hypothetical protein BJ138DRAFT_1114636 [Hygrophoropsis aurantiaca]|uniref:Uncharacterized protein n=1 Tax=Hygrophoropsis aurantiaca TaxID=72124 RepID=A0ACB8A8M7_9AGAM|nr:hypothetical protein BJ138DRAFT_1114636 [Hygrophoropsis aurantiaca]
MYLHESRFVQVNAFLKAQLQMKLTEFYDGVCHEWFIKFPEKIRLFPDVSTHSSLTKEQNDAVGVAVDKRKEQLKTWFRNHHSKKGRNVLSMTKSVSKLLGNKAKGTRAPSTNEVAMKVLYQDHVKPLVRAGIDAGLYETKGQKLMAIRTLTAAALEKAGPDVMAVIELHKELSRKKAEAEDVELEGGRPRTNAEYAQAQADFPIVAGQFCEVMESLTGCSFSIYMGGPDPHLDGEINVVSYHTGSSSESGVTFATAIPDFDARFTRPLSDFLGSVYSPSVRKSRAIGYIPHTTSSCEPSGSSDVATSSNDPTMSIPSGEVPAIPSIENPALSQWMATSLLNFNSESLSGNAGGFVPHIPAAISWPPLTELDGESELLPGIGAGFDGMDTTGDLGLPHLEYSFASTSSTPSSAFGLAPDTPITSFRNEMSLPQLSPPRLRYSLDKHATSAPPLDLPSTAKPVVPKPKPRPSYGNPVARSHYDFDFLSSMAGASAIPAAPTPDADSAPITPTAGTTETNSAAAQDSGFASTNSLPAASSAKRKRTQDEPQPRRSSRAVIPSSRHEEANRIGDRDRKKGKKSAVR